MSAVEVVDEFLLRGAALQIEGERIRWSAARGVVDAFCRMQLATCRTDVRRLLLDVPEIGRGEVERVMVPSRAQQRLSLAQMRAPLDRSLHVTCALRIRGPLHVDGIRASLQALVRLHPMLRASFRLTALGTVLLVWRDFALDTGITPIDAPGPERNDAIVEEALAAPAFDLERPPLVRCEILCFDGEDHGLLIVAHHAVCDQASLRTLTRSLAGRHSGANPSRLAVPTRSSRNRDEASAPDVSGFGFEYPRDFRAQASRRSGAVVASELPPGPSAAVLSAAKSVGATPFAVIVAAFALHASRICGDRRLAFGIDLSGREDVEDETVGMFVRRIPLVVDVDPDITVRELTALVMRSVADAMTSGLDLDDFVRASTVPVDAGEHPLVRVALTYQDARGLVPALPGLDVRGVEVPPQEMELDVEVAVQRLDDRFAVQWRYRAAIYERRSMEVMVGDFVATLQRLVDATCGTEAHVASLLVAPSSPDLPRAPEPERPTGLRLEPFLETDDLAVIAPDGALTHREVVEAVSRTAAALCVRGIGPGDTVALAVGRSVHLPGLMLGVLRAGAAFHLVDETLPSARVSAMLARLRPTLVVASLADAVDWGLPSERVTERSALTAAKPLPAVQVHGLDLAYVMHTSGSTGEPKAVGVHRRGLEGHLLSKIDLLGLGIGIACAQTASLSFDVCVWQLLAPVLAGGCCVIVSPRTLLDPAECLRTLQARSVRVLEVVPNQLAVLLEEWPHGAALPLRWLLSTGDVLDPDLARATLSAWPQVRLVNAYGPTECSDDVSHEVVTRVPDSIACVALGEPIAGARLRVVDDTALDAPFVGELAIGGSCVGHGYLGDARRTALAFVPDSRGAPGSRMYRTGDVVRRRHDGALWLLGRRDAQVKIRGQRIELGEVESVLRKVAQASEVMVAVTERAGMPALHAFVVSRDGSTGGDPRALVTEMRRRLPSAAVPVDISFVSALPTSAGGKLVRRLASEPRSELAPALDPPADAWEQLVVRCWAGLLDMDESAFGVTADFFELGGHSLIVPKMLGLLKSTTGVSVSIAKFYDAPSVRHVAALIRAGSVATDRHAG